MLLIRRIAWLFLLLLGVFTRANAQTRTWYADADTDGFGDPAMIITQAPRPPGYVLNPFDCNDNEVNATAWYPRGGAGFTSAAAGQTAMVMDAAGTPYVVYSDFAHNEKATVQKLSGLTWSTVGLAGLSAGKVTYPDIAVAGNGNVYIAYSDMDSGGRVTVMRYNDTAWERVGARGFSAGRAEYVSLAVSATHTPYVVYRDMANENKATVMAYISGSWIAIGTAGFSSAAVSYTHILVDGVGTPYICYQDGAYSSAATVMKYEAGLWTPVGNPGFSAGAAYYTAITLDENTMPYIVYQDQSNGGACTVMRFNGSTWSGVGNPGFSAGQALYTQIALSADGTPYVAYCDQTSGNKATVAKFDGSAWHTYGTAGFTTGNASYTHIAVDTLGIPYVAYTDGVNSNKATLMKAGPQLYAPAVTIGTLSTTVCANAPVVFNVSAANEGTSPRYLWKVNGIAKDTGKVFVTSSLLHGDNITCELTSNASCLLRDTAISNTLQVAVLAAPRVNLGRDTGLCEGDTLVLNAGMYKSYWWSTGDTTPTLKIGRLGVFFVTVANEAGCLGSDTITVLVSEPPVIGLPDSLAICSGTPVILDAGAGLDTYTWSTGQITQTIAVNSAGIYRVSASSGGCISADSTEITVIQALQVNMPAGIPLCEGLTAMLDAGEGFTHYLWSTGDTSRILQVYEPGIYDVTATSNNGCEAADTVTVSGVPLPWVSLGNDTILCEGTSLLLDAGAGFSTYEWSTGQATQAIIVQAAGAYAVLVQDTNGCPGRDTIRISMQLCNTGIAYTGNSSIKLYPNPVAETLRFTIEGSGIYEVEIWGADGNLKQTAQIGAQNAYMDTGKLAPGIYLARIRSEGRTVLKRFIKQ